MSKKVVVILSVLALLFAGASGALWFSVKGKLELASGRLDKLTGFSGQTFEAKLAAPAKAMAKLAEVTADAASKGETIAANETKIAGLERDKKGLETEREELTAKASELTRSRDELKGKSEEYQAAASKAESRVKELEGQVTQQVEEFAKKEEELNAKINVDKAALLTEVDKTREYYTKLYNFATSKGLNSPLSGRPWDTNPNQKSGPQFATNVFIAEIIGFDARQGIVVLNVGSESGLPRDQRFDVMAGDTVVTKVVITDVLNGGLSAATIAGSTIPNLTVGTAVKLVPSAVVEVAPAAAAK